ncbi:uncharacterized protein LOC110039472 isoform X2 [Phalaenopsis equestris]|uniref:uncharacterized protein LOC110039472 isoform X2 n=1 Tax=Phalaenopsis equestris TaxID=78828 RepID=UPI0009E3FCCB|nr:uncharacterized protein LOC110039472 isoform X2 [Phalaenopsis equestris]
MKDVQVVIVTQTYGAHGVQRPTSFATLLDQSTDQMRNDTSRKKKKKKNEGLLSNLMDDTLVVSGNGSKLNNLLVDSCHRTRGMGKAKLDISHAN